MQDVITVVINPLSPGPPSSALARQGHPGHGPMTNQHVQGTL